MAGESLITAEMRAFVGRESPPWTCEVDRSGVRMFARAAGHTDPVYYAVEDARRAGYRDLPCPPGYLGTPAFDPRAGDPQRARSEAQPQPARPLERRLNGGTEIEYFASVCAGDVLTATFQIADYEERPGRLGPMLIVSSKTIYRDPAGRVVAVHHGTSIRY